MAAVVVGVPTYRRPAELAVLLPLLLDQAADLGALPASVLVVDNDPEGSAGSVVTQVRASERPGAAPSLRYVHEPRPGIAVVRNRVLDEARAQGAAAVAMIDDDETPEPGWLASLVETWEQTGAALVAGRVVPAFAGPLDPWLAAGRFYTRRNLPTGTPLDVAAAGNLLLDVEQVAALGLRFEVGLGLAGGEDTLFSRSLHARGGALVWCAESVVLDRVPTARMTRRWVLARAMSHGDAGVRAALGLAGSRTGRGVVRARAVAGGASRVMVGGLRAGAGVLLRRDVDQARGLRAALRGAGMVRGALGLHHVAYARAGAEPGGTGRADR